MKGGGDVRRRLSLLSIMVYTWSLVNSGNFTSTFGAAVRKGKQCALVRYLFDKCMKWRQKRKIM